MTALRVLAFAIAIAAVIDPALTASRSNRPLVSLLTTDSVRNGVMMGRVERTLARRFTVVRGAIPGAAGTVLVGDEVPKTETVAPLMVVAPAHGTPFLRIIALDVPATSSLNAQIPIVTKLRVWGAKGRAVDVDVRVGDVHIDQQLLPMDGDTVEFTATMPVVPATAGATLVHVRAQVAGTNVTDEATTTIDPGQKRFAVLFFDPRPSWLTTFVRRAVERDPQFEVMHRVVTSRGVSNTGGSAPQSLRDAHSLSMYGTVVVGAPEQLTEADVSGLERFMRERGGSVVLLMDRRAAGSIDRLTGASSWHAVSLPTVDTLEATSAIPGSESPFRGLLQAREIAWPSTLPAGARVHFVNVARDSTRRAVVWSVPVGAGRLLVSGAQDSWHHRDAGSGFDTFWTTTVAQLTASAPPPVDVTLASRSIAPGQTTALRVWIRDAALSLRSDQSATVSAVIAGPNDTTNLRLWPDNSPGTFSGTVVAPAMPGTYRIIVSSGLERSAASLVVDPEARAPARDERHLMSPFAASRKGRVIQEADLADLPRALSSALESVLRVETWYPMRSAWWIVPFAFLLGAEWWWRRRRGLA